MKELKEQMKEERDRMTEDTVSFDDLLLEPIQSNDNNPFTEY